MVPLFILMGFVASKSGMSGELYRAANAMFSGARGALAMATVGACAGFGAICGSSLATAATMSRVAIPEMRRLGYSEALAAGTVASAGTLGAVIPPSLVLIIYAIIAEQGIPQLFAAAMIPGLIGTALHIGVIVAIGLITPRRAAEERVHADGGAPQGARQHLEDRPAVHHRGRRHLFRLHEPDRSGGRSPPSSPSSSRW